jgi:hypothetical protein
MANAGGGTEYIEEEHLGREKAEPLNILSTQTSTTVRSAPHIAFVDAITQQLI